MRESVHGSVRVCTADQESQRPSGALTGAVFREEAAATENPADKNLFPAFQSLRSARQLRRGAFFTISSGFDPAEAASEVALAHVLHLYLFLTISTCSSPPFCFEKSRFP